MAVLFYIMHGNRVSYFASHRPRRSFCQVVRPIRVTGPPGSVVKLSRMRTHGDGCNPGGDSTRKPTVGLGLEKNNCP